MFGIVEGNVVVTKGESVLTCDRATVNTLTNDAHAEGNVILKDKKAPSKPNPATLILRPKPARHLTPP